MRIKKKLTKYLDFFGSLFGAVAEFAEEYEVRLRYKVHHVFCSKLEIVLYTLFVRSCQTKLTGLYRTVSTFALWLH